MACHRGGRETSETRCRALGHARGPGGVEDGEVGTGVEMAVEGGPHGMGRGGEHEAHLRGDGDEENPREGKDRPGGLDHVHQAEGPGVTLGALDEPRHGAPWVAVSDPGEEPGQGSQRLGVHIHVDASRPGAWSHARRAWGGGRPPWRWRIKYLREGRGATQATVAHLWARKNNKEHEEGKR